MWGKRPAPHVVRSVHEASSGQGASRDGRREGADARGVSPGEARRGELGPRAEARPLAARDDSRQHLHRCGPTAEGARGGESARCRRRRAPEGRRRPHRAPRRRGGGGREADGHHHHAPFRRAVVAGPPAAGSAHARRDGARRDWPVSLQAVQSPRREATPAAAGAGRSPDRPRDERPCRIRPHGACRTDSRGAVSGAHHAPPLSGPVRRPRRHGHDPHEPDPRSGRRTARLERHRGG